MIGEILNAVMQEAKALLLEEKGTVILKTDFRADNLPSYDMPLLLVDLLDAPDSEELIGGATRVDWNFAFNSYGRMPDMTIDDDSGYSRDLLNVIDKIRTHFTRKQWLNTSVHPTMDDILNTYCFKWTLSGIVNADALEADGLIMGYRIVFDSVALDTGTSTTPPGAVLEHADQVDNPPFD